MKMRPLVLALTLSLLTGIPAASGNDDCSDYIDLTGMALPLTVTGTTVGAANDYGPFSSRPECWQGERWYLSSAQGADVTYKWTAPAAGEYTFSLCHSEAANTDLLLYDFTCPDEPVYPENFICGNDAGCVFNALLKDIPLTAGQSVLIVVDGGEAGEGLFELDIYDSTGLEASVEVLMDVHHIPGTSACVVGTDGTLWNGNFGMADIAASRAVTDSTLFYIASVSKPVAGAALMQLYDDGRFELDDDINDYLPFRVVHPLFPNSAMTFRMLMSHVTGIDDDWDVLESVTVCNMDSPISLGQFLEDYLTPGGLYYEPELNFTDHAPGTAYRYTNVGASLAGYLVESIAGSTHPGTTLESYCQERLFGPLGMSETSWFLSGVNIDNLAVPYEYESGSYIPLCHLGIPWYPSTLLRTSTLQLARFLAAFIRGGEVGGVRILESATVDTILTLHYPDLYDYGLFWSGEDWIDLPTWGHGGMYYGTRTFMWFFPERSVGGVVFTNGESTRGMWDISEDVMAFSLGVTTDVTEVASQRISPPRLTLQQSSPNPFRTMTAIRYELAAPAVTALEVFDVAGRLVRVLREASLEVAGIHSVHWDGRDDREREVSSGIYVYRLSAGTSSVAGKALLIR
jgi:CubicO group peptidase (beta-lactamase class C family)